MNKPEILLSIGKITNFHGIGGEVKVGYTAGQEQLIIGAGEIYASTGTKEIKLTPEKIRFHKNTAIIKFKELNSIDEAMVLKGAYLKAPKSKIEKFLEEDEFYIDDLVGVSAYDPDNNLIGIISGVSVSRGQDILFIKNAENKEYLVPFAKDIVPEIDIKEKRIVINRIEGLF